MCAAKIKDGLFVGDEDTSMSEVFINDNKISNLINLSGRDVQNVWASHGLVYLTYYWEDRPDFKLFSSPDDVTLSDIVEFIDVSLKHGISVLLFSKRGCGRCVVAACVYLMLKYRWGFEKTYDFVFSKKPDVELNKGFIQQLFALDMKLLANRQRRQGSGQKGTKPFRIEANMTIADIAAMLPPQEAKRWNGWEPDYLALPGTEAKAARPEEDPEGSEGRESGSDVEEELVLLHSFVNSRNTISALPGPYRNVLDMPPKNFKLCFHPVPLFLEDPAAAEMAADSAISRHRKAAAWDIPRAILKVSGRVGGRVLAYPGCSLVNHAMASPKNAATRNSNGAKSAELKSAKNVANNYASNPHGDSFAPIQQENVADSKNSSFSGNSHQLPRPQTQPPPQNRDLYGFVGVDAPQHSAANTIIGANSGEAKGLQEDNNNGSKPVRPTKSPPTSPSSNTSFQTMSAEDRLKHLMENMNRANASANTASNTSRPSAYSDPSANNGSAFLAQSQATNARQRSQVSAPPVRTQTNASTESNLSLYELANMQITPQNALSDLNPPKNHSLQNVNNGSIASSDMDLDLELDPLAAFETNKSNTNNNNAYRNANNNTSTARTTANAANTGRSAVRARHDVVTNAYPNLTNAKNAWMDANSSQNGQNRSSSPLFGTRPNPVKNPVPYSVNNSGSVSVSSFDSADNNTTGSVPVSRGVRAAQQLTHSVGNGSASGAKVYRHGSPSPNSRPNPSKTATPSSTLTANPNPNLTRQSSNSSIRGGTPTRYASPQSNLRASADGSSLSNTMNSVAGNVQNSSSGRRSNSPTTRSAANTMSNTMNGYNPNPQNQRRASPARGASPAPGASTAFGSSKRFSTPTPQSSQHHDYDSNSINTMNSAGSHPSNTMAGYNTASAMRTQRTSTPSKTTWRF